MTKQGFIAASLLVLALVAAFYINHNVAAKWVEQQLVFETYQNNDGVLAYRYKGKETLVGDIVPYQQSMLSQANLDLLTEPPSQLEQWVKISKAGREEIVLLRAAYHYQFWSLLPALVAIALCLLTREPITALLSGVAIGAIMLGRYDLTDQVIVPSIATEGAVTILVLYLWLLGGLLGIWSKTGAAQAFADVMTKHFVKGQRSAKLVTWLLGIIFFQGGTMSTVLVGTTVKPMADRANVSHEEMSYIVDSTASPIASILAFNAWPAYVQALIFVPGVTFLATEADRIAFFFSSIPFSFYSMFAVFGTLLVSLNIMNFSGRRIKMAHIRANNTGQLDAPNAKPLSAKELQNPQVPVGYKPHYLEFVLPLLLLIGIAVGTFIADGTPKVNWAFACALLLSALVALGKGMSLSEVMDGFGNGLKGVVVASVILMLAITIGGISKEVGGGLYLVDLLGQSLSYWLLPVCLLVITMIIAFSTGTSWGTYAVAFPLAMPLAWAICQGQHIEHAQLYMLICFACVLNGSVFGDQCSPISDTTILSSMTTGCDLMDHVKSQLPPAILAASLAATLWTLIVIFFV